MSLEQGLDELKIYGRPRISWWLKKQKKKILGTAFSVAALACSLYGGLVFYQHQKEKAAEKMYQANNIEEIKQSNKIMTEELEVYKRKYDGPEGLDNLIFTQQRKLAEFEKRLQTEVFPISFKEVHRKRLANYPLKILLIDDSFYMPSDKNLLGFDIKEIYKDLPTALLFTYGIINFNESTVVYHENEMNKLKTVVIAPGLGKKILHETESCSGYRISLECYHNRIALKYENLNGKDIRRTFFIEGDQIRAQDGDADFSTYKGMRYDISWGNLHKKSENEELWTIGSNINEYFLVNNQAFIRSDNTLFAHNIFTGKEMWRFSYNTKTKGTPLCEDVRVYVGAEDNHLYCLDSNTGNLVWKSQTNDKVRERPSVDNGRVYFGSLDSHIYVLDSRNGRRLWMHELDSPISSPPMVKDDMLYLATTNGNLYAFKKKKSDKK